MDLDPSDPTTFEEPANLRFLRRLVTVLTATMICGLIIIIGLFVMRFSTERPQFPASITLPDGATATTFTKADTWYAVTTAQDQILIFDLSGNLIQEIEITRPD